ncbi:MAG: enoyl-CoA hydratase-related protein [Planctomycetota bacterium]|nr:enoyl-CoA hydratase-related protein [Planctomycetota bacterium]
MSDSDLVLCERRGRACWLTLNRPDAANALSLPALKRLRVLLAEVATDGEIWAVVITGAGAKAFCAGADLKERRGFNEAQVKDFVATIRATMDEVAALPQPVIAALNGHAFGGGCELALACDLRVIDARAQIGLTETSLAIIPGAGGCARLPRLVGAAKAKEMILLARRMTATEAYACGLVNEISDEGAVVAAAERMAAALLRNGPLALRAAKAAVDGGLDLPMAQALQHEAACYRRIIPTEDRLEALQAFAEKRAPDFQGR